MHIRSKSKVIEAQEVTNNLPSKSRAFSHIVNLALINNKIAGLIMLAAVAIGISAYLFIYQEGPFEHKYQPAVISEAVDKNGNGIKFNKPPEFKNSSEGISKSYVHQFIQTEKVNNKSITTAQIYTATAPIPPQYENYVNSFNTALKDSPNSKAFKDAILPTKNTVDFMLRDYSNRIVNNPKPFTNKTIKKNAWIFDISATDAKNGAPDQQGMAIYTWTDNTAYFYILTVAKNNWQPNIDTWKDMLASIEIK